jgi:hypothetical protein
MMMGVRKEFIGKTGRLLHGPKCKKVRTFNREVPLDMRGYPKMPKTGSRRKE